MHTTAPTAALMVLALAACASSGARALPAPAPFPQPGRAPGDASGTVTPVTTADGYAVAMTALSLRGIPYRAGGEDTSGFDCSGFVHYVFALHGLPVPRRVLALFNSGFQVSVDRVQAGDLLFFATVALEPTHVAIAIGEDEFVHAPSSQGEVRVERLSARYWATRFLGARRVLALP